MENILIGEDDPVQRKMAAMLLSKRLGYAVMEAGSGTEVIQLVESSNLGDIQAVLLDINMPGMDGFEVLKRLRQKRPDLPVIMLTGADDVNLAVKAIKQGASDFIVKPPSPVQLDVSLKNAIRLSTLSRELSRLKRDKIGALGFADLVGHNGALASIIATGRKAAASDVTVLLTGETSTGKELFARAIHGESKRVGAPFIAVNCSALPEATMESVLFGSEKSSASNPAIRNLGKFREAERGTIFLDDIHCLSADAQVKLLRVLQHQEIEPVGASKPLKMHVRVITATHQPLHDRVASGQFREDLYFRLNVLTIQLPSLHTRGDDILALAEYFLQRFSSTDSLPYRPLSSDAKHYVRHYSWPGNLREMESLLHRALVMCEQETIDRELLQTIHHPPHDAADARPLPGSFVALRHTDGRFKTIDTIERDAMQHALEYYEGNITKASAALGMAKSTFYRKISDARENNRDINNS